MKKLSLLLCIAAGVAFGGRFEIWQNHADALYRVGEEAVIRVTYYEADGSRAKSGTVDWRLDNFGSKRLGAGQVDLSKENPFFVRGQLDGPDFLRLTVACGADRRIWSVGYDVEKIRQDVPAPADFDAYWQGEKARLEREVPLDPRCERVNRGPEYDTYKVSFATFNQRRVHGFMTIPADKSLYPARVRIRVCDAGDGCIGPWEGNAGEITATFSVHAFEPAGDPETQRQLLAEQNRALGVKWHLGTNAYNAATAGIDGQRGDYFFHDAMLGISRAVDWIVARPEADRSRVVYFGSSQGGGFGLYLAYLNGGFTRACFAVPALTGHFGDRAKRQNGWPNLLGGLDAARRARAEANAPYYDGVNFASRIKIPVRFIVGFSDTTCPPPDVYAAFNACPSRDKAILNGIGCTHCRENGWIGWLRDRAKVNPLFDYNGWLRAPGARRTRVQLWYDTEDFVNPASWDAAREVARIMTEEGVRGNFNVVGYLAKVLVDNRRFDVIDALKKHVIGTQTLYHSLHPNIVEIADLKDYGEAYRRTLKDEAEGYGMLRAAFNLDRLILSCYPGCSSSHVALDVHSDLGAIFHGGLGAFGGQLPSGDRVWYQNMLQIDYNGTMSLQDVGLSRDLDDAQIAERLDQAARKDAVVFYMHPCMAPCSEFWDGVNFRRGNWCEYGFWQPSERREAKVTAHFYARFRAFLRQLKADSRFEIVDCEKLAAAIRPRQPITKADLPAIRASLAKGLGPVSSPASWCVADVFHAAVAFLNGAERYLPGKVYGFLERPVGVAAPVMVKAADVRAAAKKLAVRRHLPVVYDVGGVKVGPADFLFAMLDALDGVEDVRVAPREQLGDVAAFCPPLADFTHRGKWIYEDSLKDEHLADRLRWQFWTMRYE